MFKGAAAQVAPGTAAKQSSTVECAHLACSTSALNLSDLKYCCIAFACWRWYSRVTPLQHTHSTASQEKPVEG